MTDTIAAIRRFNRFYTRQIGLLQDGLLDSPFSLTEVRVLYELAHRDRPTAGELGRDLGLDAGYLSRILKRFESRGLLARTRSEADSRQSHLSLTEAGTAAFAPLDRRSHDEVAAMLAVLAPAAQAALAAAMRQIQELLEGRTETVAPCRLRAHRPGDMGWIVHRHGVLYAEEYGWNESFEALVAKVVAQFVDTFDPAREKCWIAERGDAVVGSVFLVAQSNEVAKLRLLYVEPSARGIGIGRHLVEECIGFARTCGYRRITLWTNSILIAARHIYEQAGFELVASEPHHSFGHDLVGETWELPLEAKQAAAAH